MSIDLLFAGGQVFNAHLKRFIPADLAVHHGKIVYAGPKGAELFEAEETVNVSGQFIIPGLIDSHMHIQSSMMSPRAFSAAVLPHGVTTVVSEPHEIANVFGLDGVRESLRAAGACALDIRLAMPSSVPSARPDLETAGGEIGLSEIMEMMEWPRTVCLGEVMNMHDVISEPNGRINQIIRSVRENRPHWPIEGHCPRVSGKDLAAVIAAGIGSDHTEQTLEGMKERIRMGMIIQLQRKSLRPELLAYIDQEGLEDSLSFVTDDTMPDTLLREGHLDEILRIAVSMGYPAEKAVYCATWTPAQRMRLFDRGALDPGRIADFVILDDPARFTISSVWKKGRRVPQRRSLSYSSSFYPAEFYNSVHVPPQEEKDFRVPASIEEGTVRCRAALVQEHSTMTVPAEAELPVRGGYIDWESSPWALASVIERHGLGGGRGFLFVGGAALKHGAAASTYSHDAHNLLVIGQNGRDMAAAANDVIEKQGGISVAADGHLLASAALPVAGILSEEPVELLGEEIERVRESLSALRWTQDNPVMSMATLALPVSPALKVTDKGIVDVKNQQLVPLVMEAK